MKLPKAPEFIHEDVVGLVVTGIVLLSVIFKLVIVWLAGFFDPRFARWVNDSATLDHICTPFRKRSLHHKR